MDVTFGGLGDLPESLMGNLAKTQVPGNSGVTDTSSARPVQVWDLRENRKAELINNDASVLGIPDRRLEDQIKMNEAENRRKMVLRRMMAGCTDTEFGQLVAHSESGDKLASLRPELGLLGNVYLDRSAFSTCDDLRSFWRQHRNHFAENLVTAPSCKDCRLIYNGICPKVGLKVAAKVEYSPQLLQDLKDRLIAAGRIQPEKEILSKEHLRQAFQNVFRATENSCPKEGKATGGNHGPSPEEMTERFRAEIQLKKAAEKAEAVSSQIEMMKPVLRAIHEMILEGANNEMLKLGLSRKFLSASALSALTEPIKRLVSDIPLRAGLTLFPVLYSRCEDLKSFLQKRGIRRPNVIATGNCVDCKWQNSASCSLLGAKILFANCQYAEDEIMLKIEEICGCKGVPSAHAAQMKEAEKSNYLAGLSAAYGASKSKRVSIDVVYHKPEQNHRANCDCVGRQKLVAAIVTQIAEGVTISKVRLALQASSGREADSILQEAIHAMSVIPAVSIDFCLVGGDFSLPSGVLITASEKCVNCQWNRNIGCDRLGRLFTSIDFATSFEGVNEPEESKAINEFFHGSSMQVTIDSPTPKPDLKVELENKDVPVDIANSSPDNDPNFRNFFGTEFNLDLDSKNSGTLPLDVDLGSAPDLGEVP